MNFKIITFHNAINYGAVLQSFALQKSIQELVCNKSMVSIYNHNCLLIKSCYKVLSKPNSVKMLIKLLVHLPFLITKKFRFCFFMNKYYNISNKYDLTDVFITGSDQVWNYNCTDFDKFYFLDFLHNKSQKNAYAASFGFNEIPLDYLDEYRRLLNDFSRISVREKQGQTIIRSLLNRDVPALLDPTLLLNKEQWTCVSNNKHFRRKYVLIYLMNDNNSILNFAKKLSKRKGLKIYYITDSITCHIDNCKLIHCAGPKNWLSLFLNAEYIVTNSFHGTAFAINFNKPFFTELLPEHTQVNSRLENILDLFNLRERQIIDGHNNNVDEPIDYESVNKTLENERKKSINFLMNIIEGINE